MSRVDPYTCDEVFERINDYLDRELSAGEMAMVRQHLETCAICASEYSFEGNVLEDLKSKLRRIDLPQSVVDKVRDILSNPGLNPPK